MLRDRRGRRVAVRATVLALLIVLGWSGVLAPASAHPFGLPAFARVALTGEREVTLLWNAAPDDVAVVAREIGVAVGPGGLLTAEQDAALATDPAFTRVLLDHLVIVQDGTVCDREVTVTSPVREGATLHATCPAPVTDIEVRVTLLSGLDAQYRTLTLAGTAEGTERAMLTGEAPAATFALDAAAAEQVLAAAPVAPAVPGDGGEVEGRSTFGGSLPFESRFVALIDAPAGALAAVAGVAVALLVGLGHGLAPGHGKAIAASYLVGSRGRPRDAVLLGVTVAAMHTGSVLVIGAALYHATSRPATPVLSAWLELAAGVVVAAVGTWLLVRRWRPRSTAGPGAGAGPAAGPAARPDAARHAAAEVEPSATAHVGAPTPVGVGTAPATVGTLAVPVPRDAPTHVHEHDHGHVHTHDHDHGHAHTLPPDVHPLSRQGLVALGAAGGLLPSPSGLLVLFTALAADRLTYGLVLIAGFSLGLATTVTAVGLAVLWGRDAAVDRFGPRAQRLLRHAPVAGAGVVLALGIGVALRAGTTLW